MLNSEKIRGRIVWKMSRFHRISNDSPYLEKFTNSLLHFIHVTIVVSDRSFLVANAHSDSFHIIFCSDGFCKMTGFTRAEVMQRSSTTEFLHGPMTSQQAVNLIREALSKGFEKHFEILYYRKDGRCNLFFGLIESVSHVVYLFSFVCLNRNDVSLFRSHSTNSFGCRRYFIVHNQF